MAQWKETLEPYIKVHEEIKTTTLNPTAGEDLIIGVTLISDAGPATPTLITSQSEFIKTYTSQDITKDYIESLNELYLGADKTTAATMWCNGYRLAGSNTLLVVRASKANDLYFTKPLNTNPNDLNTYVLRDGELLKRVSSFKIVKDVRLDEADVESGNGWSISINGVGVLGNRTNDDGAQYDYFVNNIPDLVDVLNDTSKFFSPSYKFYSDERGSDDTELSIDMDSSEDEKGEVKSVIFNEVYLGVDILDKDDKRVDSATGMTYLITCEPKWELDPEMENNNENQKIIDLNSPAYSGFVADPYYATNVYNSATDLRVRIRRFNHDAVVSKELSDSEKATLTAGGPSQYIVLEDVLKTFTKDGTEEPSDNTLYRDFYEVAILDPSVNDIVSFFTIGNIMGRGDMEVSEINNMLNMIQLTLPDNMHDLGLNYYNYGDENGCDTMFVKLAIDPRESDILKISDTDLKRALDQIALDEVYTTEGLSDLGNTEPSFQSYMANMAMNINYFYPISTLNSTNYMTIGNGATRISQDSYKLYMSSPWDIDTGTMGWKYYASPSVLYWEAVARNRRNNNEFASIIGQSNGIMQYQRPVVEFNKRSRQLLLSKRVNTVLWNVATQAWNMNDCYTKQNENNIMGEDGNSRLGIRICKAMPTILKQFIGKKITEKLCEDVKAVIRYFFTTVILPMNYTVESYNVICNYDEALARQNKIKVVVQVRFSRSLKFIDVYAEYYDVGMEFEEPR